MPESILRAGLAPPPELRISPYKTGAYFLGLILSIHESILWTSLQLFSGPSKHVSGLPQVARLTCEANRFSREVGKLGFHKYWLLRGPYCLDLVAFVSSGILDCAGHALGCCAVLASPNSGHSTRSKSAILTGGFRPEAAAVTHRSISLLLQCSAP